MSSHLKINKLNQGLWKIRNRVERVNENKTQCCWCDCLEVFGILSSVNDIILEEKASHLVKGVGIEILTETFNLTL